MAAPQPGWMLCLACLAKFQLRMRNVPTGKVGILNLGKNLGFQLIRQWNSFISSANNKAEVIKFIVAEWKKNARLFSNRLINITCTEDCFFIFEGNCSTADQLFSTQEEAGTCLLLHAHDESQNHQDIIIQTLDTDVFILAITIWSIEARIFIKTGKQNKLRLTDVEEVVNVIDYENKVGLRETFLELHVFTGCDTTGTFYGHGKVKAPRAMLKHDSLMTFRLLGQECQVLQELFDELQVISFFLHEYLIPRNLQAQNQRSWS